MAHKCFLSFHYRPDNWRVQKVKQMGAIEGQAVLDSNGWETVKRGGDVAIQKWIDDHMKNRECLVVLVGEKTAGRRWVNYEIKTAWGKGMGVLAIHIHNIEDRHGIQAKKGGNPFTGLTVDGKAVTGKVYDPPYSVSKNVYSHISENIESWVSEAVKARG
jgi:MTH538 TIR-like domain (DUF1863)